MTPAQKQLLRDTWQQVAPIADTAAELFYNRLFEIDPSTRPLFKGVDMQTQGGKLMKAITGVIQGLDHLEMLVPTIEDLGRRHVGYGVRERHYDSVGAALLWTLEQGLGPAWTPEVKATWAEAYGVISGIMREAARQVTPAERSSELVA
ncbi:MAG: globin family protein [Alphaproteobacteria bacterium]|nr:globin family protein [Alphaproteobacteria bacterium]